MFSPMEAASAMPYEIHEMGLGGILDQAIRLTKDHLALFFMIVLILYIPLFFVEDYLVSRMDNIQHAELMAEDLDETRLIEIGNELLATLFIGFLIFLLMSITIIPLVDAAMIWAVARRYLGEATSVGNALGNAFRVLVPLVITGIIKFIIVVIGFMFLIIPGIYLFFAYFLSPHVVVLEGTWGFAALDRSHALMKGNMLTAFVLGIILLIITILLFLVSLIFPGGYVRSLVSFILQGIVAILGAAAMVVLYFSARCKHENFDLMILVKPIDQEAGAAQPQV